MNGFILISHYVKPGAGRFLDYLLLEHWFFAIHDIDDEKKAWSVIITQFMLHKWLLVREIVTPYSNQSWERSESEDVTANCKCELCLGYCCAYIALEA